MEMKTGEGELERKRGVEEGRGSFVEMLVVTTGGLSKPLGPSLFWERRIEREGRGMDGGGSG